MPDVQLLTPPVLALVDGEDETTVALAYTDRLVLLLDGGGEQRTRWVAQERVARLGPLVLLPLTVRSGWCFPG